MSDVKREMIFGDESLFDGAPEDAEFAGWFCQEIRWYMIHDGLILFSDGGSWCTSDNPYISSDIAAMRRIIPAPKRWTQADKEARRLPEIGAFYDVDGCQVEHLGVGIFDSSDNFYYRYPSGDCGWCRGDTATPIETSKEEGLTMSEQYKYEPIFGDQSLFYGAPEDAVSVRYGKSEHIFDSEEIKATTGQLRDVPVVAMRRIIRTPTWTNEDRKAWKLPEVGSEIAGDVTGINNVLFSSDEFIVTLSQGGAVGKYSKEEVFDYFNPIESPEEKAARLEDEWIKSNAEKLPQLNWCDWRRLYNALLSGDLPVPVKE